jgi:hypothetical protein
MNQHHFVRRFLVPTAAGAMLAAVVSLAALAVPARAQSYPVAFAAPSTFQSYPWCSGTCPSSGDVATGDFNGDGKLDVVNIDTQHNLNLMLGNGDGTFGTALQPVISVSLANGYFIPEALAVGDFNGDGHLDAAVWGPTNQTGGGEAEIVLGDGAGGLTIAGSYFTPVLSNNYNFPSDGLAVADVNGDGKLDLISLTSFTGGAYVFPGNGDGSFQTAVNYSVGTTGQAEALAVADVNHDGKPDIVVSINNGIGVLLNHGRTFGAPIYYDSAVGGGQAYGGIAIGDVNGDNQPDVVETNAKGNVVVFTNQGSGTFAVGGTTTVPGLIFSSTDNLLLADINNDKKLDVVVVDFNGDVHTFYGKGNGTFTTGPGYPLGTFYGYNPLVALGDFNEDGTLDLLNTASYYFYTSGNGGLADYLTSSVSLGRGDGTFRTAQFYGYGDAGGHNIVTADFNGDGVPDVAYSYVATNVGTQNEDFAVMLGSSHGALGAPSFAQAGTCTANLTEWIATGDVNQDGKVDIVSTLALNSGTGCQNHVVAVITGKGNGQFNPAKYYPTGATGQEYRVYLGDINGDGHPDIVAENMDGTISVLLNKGNGTFKPGVLITSVAALYAGDLDLAVADLNGDGRADIAATSHVYTDYNLYNDVWVLLSNANGTFSAPITNATTYYLNTPVAADFNHDGKTDLAVSIYRCNSDNSYLVGYEFLQGNGDGTFTEQTGTAGCNLEGQNNAPSQAIGADFNGDGNEDVFVVYPGGYGTPLLLQGAGNGTFSVVELANYPGGVNASAAAADFNGDGMPDIAVLTNFNLGAGNSEFVNYVSEIQNSSEPVSVSPLSVKYGSVSVGSSATGTVVLTNDQASLLSIGNIRIGGANSGDFSAKSACGSSLKGGWDCTVTVTFKPTATGTRSATLSIADSVGTQTVQLSGTGK